MGSQFQVHGRRIHDSRSLGLPRLHPQSGPESGVLGCVCVLACVRACLLLFTHPIDGAIHE